MLLPEAIAKRYQVLQAFLPVPFPAGLANDPVAGQLPEPIAERGLNMLCSSFQFFDSRVTVSAITAAEA